jgi:hypothetical protein
VIHGNRSGKRWESMIGLADKLRGPKTKALFVFRTWQGLHNFNSRYHQQLTELGHADYDQMTHVYKFPWGSSLTLKVAEDAIPEKTG